MADNDGNKVRIIIWCVPRTISTALTKCLSAIDGMEIWFETFHFCALVRRQFAETYGEDLPMVYDGNEEMARAAAKNSERLAGTKLEPDRIIYDKVKQGFLASTSKYVLCKDIYFAFPDDKTREYLPFECKHVFLIRDPYRVFSSYRKAVRKHLANVNAMTESSLSDKAFDMERDDPILKPNEFYSGTYSLWKYVRANIDRNPIVLNADDVLADPAAVLSKFCKETGLPYSDSLLRWDASPDVVRTWVAAGDDVVIDGKAFYGDAIKSCRFLPPDPDVPREELPPDVRKLGDQAMPYYEEMNQFKI